MKYANDTVIIHTGNPNENNSYWALRAFLSHAAAVQHTRIETSWLATSCPTCWIANWYLSHQWTTTWMFLTLYRGSAILSDNMIYLLPETSRTATHVVSRVCELFARQSNWQWLISGGRGLAGLCSTFVQLPSLYYKLCLSLTPTSPQPKYDLRPLGTWSCASSVLPN